MMGQARVSGYCCLDVSHCVRGLKGGDMLRRQAAGVREGEGVCERSSLDHHRWLLATLRARVPHQRRPQTSGTTRPAPTGPLRRWA